MKKTIITIVISLSILSCVPTKKYNDLLTKKVRLEGDFAECQDSLNASNSKNKQNKEDINRLTSTNKSLVQDSILAADNLKRLNKLINEQTSSNDRLRKDYKDLLSSYSAESNKLSSNLAKKEQQLLDLEKNLQSSKIDNDKLLTDLKEREKRLKELENVLHKKDSAVVALKNIVSDALLAFKDKGLSINVKNGKVYVSLSEKLLFNSGSTQVDKKGEEALKQLAGVLKSQKDVNVMVEGHTDDVPVVKGASGFTDNWDLSVLRATDITRILVKEGVDPKKITPCGRSEYSPLASGKSAEIRQKNRRTEIILTPKLDELFKILETD